MSLYIKKVNFLNILNPRIFKIFLLEILFIDRNNILYVCLCCSYVTLIIFILFSILSIEKGLLAAAKFNDFFFIHHENFSQSW